MSQTLTVIANGVDITNVIEMESMEGDNELTENMDLLRFTIIDPTNSTAIEGKQEVTVSDNLGNTLFGGLVSLIRRKSETLVQIWDVEVQGWACLLESTIVNELYLGQTDTYIITNLLSKYLPEISSAGVLGGLTIDHISLPYKTLREALESLCKLSGYRYYVDPGKVLHYFPTAGISAPFGISTSPDNVATFAGEDWYIEEDASQIQNQITVTGANYVSAPITDTFTGDGHTTTFALSQKPHSVQSVTTAGSPEVVGLGDGIDAFAAGYTVLVSQKAQTATYQTAPGSGQAIAVTYNYEAPVIVRARNNASIAFYGRTFAGKINDSTLLSNATANDRATTALNMYAYARWHGEIGIRTFGIHAGMSISIVNSVDGINGNFLVTGAKFKPLGNGVVRYNIEFIG